jgi:peptidoglycan/LPS O-acetylase OafA/YrhL
MRTEVRLYGEGTDRRFLTMKLSRSISSIIIMCTHTQWFGFFAMQNKAEMYRFSNEIAQQWVTNSTLLVDLFLTVSGFLMSYGFFKNQKQMEQIRTDGVGANLRRFGRLAMERYLR